MGLYFETKRTVNIKKLGTFHNQQGSMIVSDPAFLKPDPEFNMSIPVVPDSTWTVWYNEDDQPEINLVYLTIDDHADIAADDFDILEGYAVVDSSQLVVMNTAAYGKREAIDWEIRNTLEFDDEIDPFYVAISDEMMEEEIFLFPFGVAVQLMGDGHYKVRVRRDADQVTGILLVIGEHEDFEEDFE